MRNSAALSFRDKSGQALAWLAKPHLLFYVLPWLMVLLVAGTIAQKPMGLFQAQQMFFSSFMFWLGPLPLPGGYTILGLIFINLLAKFILGSRWSGARSGIIITHFGALLLLLGGAFTAATSTEGFMMIPEGESTPYISDYHQRELTVTRDDHLVFSLPHQTMKDGTIIADPALPFAITVVRYCHHCRIITRPEATDTPEGDLRSLSQFMALQPEQPMKDDESNFSGATLRIDGAGPDQDGIYVAFDGMSKYPRLQIGDHLYAVRIGKKQTALPFSIRLEDFKKETYPGTDTAKSYESKITVQDGALSWPALISMNHPLRYKGYTFYQSSFSSNGDKEATVLSVVRNSGRIFPYAASIVISLGLLLHLVITAELKRGRNKP